MFQGGNYFYYIEIGLQAFCAIHCMRRGTQNKWIWIIVFLPVVGCIAYIYSEVLSKGSSFGNPVINKPGIDVGAVLNPGGRIKKLENDLKFTDTFTNRIKLADAYLAGGHTDKAIELYKASLTGAFAENEHVLAQLMAAYFEQERYEEVIPIAKKIYKLPQFPLSKSHILYAKSLEYSGDVEEAEKEFKTMKGRYSNFGPRYEYGLFLVRNEHEKAAFNIFTEMLNEEPHLSAVEKKANRTWFIKAKEELKKIGRLPDTD